MLHLDDIRPQAGCARLQAVLHWVASVRKHWVASIGSQGSGTMGVTSSKGPVKEAWRVGAGRETCTVKGGEIGALVGHQSTAVGIPHATCGVGRLHAACALEGSPKRAGDPLELWVAVGGYERGHI